MRTVIFILVFAVVVIGLPGCMKPTTELSSAPPPVSVTVSVPVEREVTDFIEYTARTAAVDSVEVRAHVWGYLQKVNFKEGDIVKAGDVLFEIDPRPYVALLDQVKAKVRQDEAQLAFDEAEFQRQSVSYEKGGTSKSELDKARAARDVDVANVASDKSLVASRQLDLDYTKVTAPVGGRVSRYVVTIGNLIQAGNQNGGTLLTTIVSVDPMYAWFDVDEQTALKMRRLIREGKQDSPRDGGYPVSFGLGNEDGFPHRGTINFVENQVNPKTGTIRVRGVFPNANQVLLPGFFGRVRSPIGRPHNAVLVADRAIDSDQGRKVVYVLDEKNVVAARTVKIGSLHNGLREITEGLKPRERLVVNGLQQIRPGVTVEPKLAEMPGSPLPASFAVKR